MRSSFLGPAAMIAVMVAAVPMAAQARIEPSETGRKAVARFKALDHDGDRILSRKELGGGSESLFVMLDADGDGRLSLREVEGAGGGRRLARFEAYDADKNAYLTRREFPARVDGRLFAAFDRDGDRHLALGEIRPSLGGGQGSRPDAPMARKARPAPEDRPLCWVPNFGAADDWLIEMPVLGSSYCRTQ